MSNFVIFCQTYVEPMVLPVANVIELFIVVSYDFSKIS
jgi:hypothetical protein